MDKTTPIGPAGPWDRREVDAFLQASRYPLRLACSGVDGYPRVLSLWYLYRDGEFCCVTHRSAKLIDYLRAAPQVGFEVAPNEPPYCGVRGTGDARIYPLGDDPVFDQLIENYLGNADSSLARWLLSRRRDEMRVQIAPRTLSSWDYRKRMRDVRPAAND